MPNLQRCRVACLDSDGVTHAIEVTAESLHEAVGLALHTLRKNGWVGELVEGLARIDVVVTHPAVTHSVQVKDWKRWLDRPGRSPREIALKSRLRSLL